jgi:SAM-dependent methyltransferase
MNIQHGKILTYAGQASLPGADRLSSALIAAILPSIRRAMKFPGLHLVARAARKGRDELRRRMRRPLPGQFQPYSHTRPDRYPWLFEFAKTSLGDGDAIRLLSFGCSRGEEVFTLRNYFPSALIKGMDINPDNIARCTARSQTEESTGISFTVAASTEDEPTNSYDAIFCLAVLCLGDLSNSRAQRCDPHLQFIDFEHIVTDFARCLKPGGLLFLHTANFRFSDTAAAPAFEVVLKADPAQLAPDPVFGRDNRLLQGVRYLPVAFRKRRDL